MHSSSQAVDTDVARSLVAGALAAGRSALNEYEAKTLLWAYGIPIPEGALVRTEAEAAEAAVRLGGGLAVKAVGSEIHHKTELGLVLLNVEGPEATAAAFRLLEQRAGAALEGVLVERMVSGNRELMVGMNRDSMFGPVVAFGLGGVLTEALGDVALALAPVDDEEADALPGLIRAGSLLGAFRGYPPVDQTELAKVIQAIGQIALDCPEVSEIDVNPLLVEGDRPLAADALVILSMEGAAAAPTSVPAPTAVSASPVAPDDSAPAAAPAVSADSAPARAFVSNLKALLAPRSMAIVGASDDIGKWGGSALRSILDGVYTGKVYPVNPKGGEFFGLRAYTSLEELPETPDLALLAVGGRQIASLLEECGRKGIPAAIAIAAGFSETGDSGAEAEREIARVACRGGVTLMGPNCMGMISNEVSLHAIGFVVQHPLKGTLSLVSQSGNVGIQTISACRRRGVGIDKFASVGNEAQIGAADVIDYLRDDPNTTGIMAYIEGLDDGRRFVEVARRTSAVKPVIVLRVGLTEYGRKAAASHTGALAGSAAVWEAAARKAGVITCSSAQELVDLGSCLTYNPLPKGRRVAIVTNGGGAGVMMADEVARHGLTLAAFPPEFYEAMDEILPSFWSRQNPLDMVACAGGDVAPRVLRLVAECDTADAIVVLSVLGVASSGSEVRATSVGGEYAGLSPWETAFVDLVTELMETTGKPIINVPDGPLAGSLFDRRRRYPAIVLPTPRAAARGLDRMEWYGAFRRRAGQHGTQDL